jgi:peptidoglycan/LPS O-acetylase OafA/YrhL
MYLSQSAPATTTLNPKTEPYRLLDAFRGVAALWVLSFHALHWWPGFHAPFLSRSILYRFAAQGSLGVCLFFVISGYCIAAAAESSLRRRKPIVQFVIVRLRRIYPPYVASSIVAVLFYSTLGVLVDRRILPTLNSIQTNYLHEPFRFYVAALTLTQVPMDAKSIIPVYWSLCYEIAFYAIVAVLLALLGRVSLKAFYAGLNVVTVGSLIWILVGQCPFPLVLWYQFGLGAMVYMLIASPKDRVVQAFFGATVLLMLFYIWRVEGPHSLGHPSTRVDNVVTLSFALLVLGLQRWDKALAEFKPIKVLEWLGTFSYSLYLTHWLTIIIPLQIVKKIGGHHGTFWLAFAAQIVFAIPTAYLFHLLFEKPFMSRQAKKREADSLAIVHTG